MLFSNIFHDTVARIESGCTIKVKHVLLSCFVIAVLGKKNCTRTEALVQFFPCNSNELIE